MGHDIHKGLHNKTNMRQSLDTSRSHDKGRIRGGGNSRGECIEEMESERSDKGAD